MEATNRKPLRVDKSKIVDYLLHPANSRGKAAFFRRMGFSAARWQELVQALKEQGNSGTIVAVMQSPHGTRYSIEGRLATPDRRKHSPWVRTIWIGETGSDMWRLVTAYPLPRSSAL